MSSGHGWARRVFIERMANDRTKDATNVHLHIKVIYLLITVLCFGFAFATWICMTEIRQLRSDLDSETAALRRGEVVEFDDDVVVSHGDVAWDDHDTDSASGGSIPRKEVTIESMDDRVRMRRGAKRRRSRPAFYVDEGKEGSGDSDAGGSDDWVWLTSYSRIPVGGIGGGIVIFADVCSLY